MTRHPYAYQLHATLEEGILTLTSENPRGTSQTLVSKIKSEQTLEALRRIASKACVPYSISEVELGHGEKFKIAHMGQEQVRITHTAPIDEGSSLFVISYSVNHAELAALATLLSYSFA